MKWWLALLLINWRETVKKYKAENSKMKEKIVKDS